MNLAQHLRTGRDEAMTYRRDEIQDEFENQVRPGLVDDLRGSFGNGPAVPPERNRRIIAAAHAQILGRSRSRLLRRWGGAAAAVAAVVLVAVMLLPRWERASYRVVQQRAVVPVAPATVADARDVNTDGNVNILDAYLLAKRVERMESLDRAMDFNADGTVDRGDADVLAAASVQLKGGGVR